MRFARRTLAAFGLVLLLAGSAAAATVAAKSYPTGSFSVGGHVVAARDVMDARALPDVAGNPSLMVTLTPAAAAAIGAKDGAPVSCLLDGKPIGTGPAEPLASEHVLQISGTFASFDAAAAIARRISGRDPLPESEGDE